MDYYCDPPQFQSYQHINGYKSAILDLYKDRKGDVIMGVPTFMLESNGKGNLKAIWDLWWSGNVEKRYRPYRLFKGFDLSNKSDRPNLSKVNRIMKVLLTDDSITVTAISRMTAPDRDRTFERLFLNLYHQLFPEQDDDYFDKRKLGELSYLTIFDNLHKLTTHVV